MSDSQSLTPRQQKVAEVFNILRPYQKKVFEDMYQQKGHLNYMDMGLGKTLVTSSVIMYAEAFPCMIICTKAAMYVWELELKKWFDEEALIYNGKPKEREAIWKDFVTRGVKFIITTYALSEELGERFGVLQAKKQTGSSTRGTTKAKATTPPGTHKWNLGGVIADEIQLGGLFNHKSKTYGVVKKLCGASGYRFLLTGTPYRRGVVDFYGPLSIVRPDVFDSYWKFVAQWCLTIDTGFGKSIERTPKNVIAFRAMIRQYASILKKVDHASELPGKIRQPIPVKMNPEQALVYSQLTDELYAFTQNGELLMTPSVLSLMVRQRQLLACPQELGLGDRGAAIDAMLEMGGELIASGKSFVVFTAFKKAVYWIKKALEEEHPGLKIFTITGGLSPEEFRDAWQGFQNTSPGRPAVLICVIKSGASFHATRADTAFFIGPEWDFNQNEQAEDRLNRIGQEKLVTCYYPMHKDTVDDDVIERLNQKKYGADLVLSEEEAFQKMLAKRGQ